MELTPAEAIRVEAFGLDRPERRTKRRYAHELYPHGNEYETRPLAVEVPYLYARADGLDIHGTGWFEADGKESGHRVHQMLDARMIAFLADALLQGLTGDEAWQWADQRAMEEDGSWVYERAEHYGVNPDLIKPYPCGPKLNHHDHFAEPDARGWRIVTRAPGAEDDCEECTEAMAL